ncbi:hypothetical protein, partial [Nonomuraea sp. NPDC049607]|uniref:hypothetical protein n=1 Tax=Nonomuraea sp. NPDC049607 TaxID=3154732 RepID=UPI00342F6D3E
GKLEWAREEFAAVLNTPPPVPRSDPWRRTSGTARSGRPIPGVPSYDQYTYARVRAAELDAALAKLHAAALDLSERRLRAQYARTAGPGAPPFEQVRDNLRRQLVIDGYERALQARAAS